ncbi:hypothetical protein ACFWHW_33705, partial [Streptomyces pharetrae]
GRNGAAARHRLLAASHERVAFRERARERVHRRRSLPRSVRACARVRGSDAARRADAMARRP